MAVLDVVVGALWAMLPAYVPNNGAVVFGGGRPLDGGRTLGDARLLGDGKTWRGTVGGVATGLATAGLLTLLREPASAALGVDLVGFTPLAAVGLAAGAMAGDVGASFVKRRLDRERGTAAPGLDQLDFVVGALLLTALLDPAWFGGAFPLPAVAVVVVVTPAIHLAANVVAYATDLKEEPW